MHVTWAHVTAILYLVLLESILSIDNALALAALVKKRLKNIKEQQRALRYGIVGAYVFRVAIIFAGVWLMHHLWIKWMAAGYLVYLGISELFFTKPSEDDYSKNNVNISMFSPLWNTVIAVELIDIMFSIDSVAVAISVSDIAWVLITGAFLGILAMRFAAQVFIKLMHTFPILEKTAFVLVLMAGIKIIVELIGYKIDEIVFMSFIIAVLVLSFVVHYLLLLKTSNNVK